jgi:hypothetical protein
VGPGPLGAVVPKERKKELVYKSNSLFQWCPCEHILTAVLILPVTKFLILNSILLLPSNTTILIEERCSQSIYTRLHVSALIGPSSDQKNAQWFKNELTMGSHLVKINYYKIYKNYFHVVWTDIQWIDHTGSTQISRNMFHTLLHYVNILWWTDGVSF